MRCLWIAGSWKRKLAGPFKVCTPLFLGGPSCPVRCAALLLPACEVPSLSPVPGTSSPAPLPFSHTYSSLHPFAAAAPLLAPPLRPHALFPSPFTAKVTTTYISSAAATSRSRSCGCRNRAEHPQQGQARVPAYPVALRTCVSRHTHTHPQAKASHLSTHNIHSRKHLSPPSARQAPACRLPFSSPACFLRQPPPLRRRSRRRPGVRWWHPRSLFFTFEVIIRLVASTTRCA